MVKGAMYRSYLHVVGFVLGTERGAYAENWYYNLVGLVMRVP